MLTGEDERHQVGDAATRRKGAAGAFRVADQGTEFSNEETFEPDCRRPALPSLQTLVQDGRHQLGRSGGGESRRLHPGHGGGMAKIDGPARRKPGQSLHHHKRILTGLRHKRARELFYVLGRGWRPP